jgi:hypothetical protein
MAAIDKQSSSSQLLGAEPSEGGKPVTFERVVRKAGERASDEEDTVVDVDLEQWGQLVAAVKANRCAKIGARNDVDGETRFSLRSSTLDDDRIVELCMAPLLMNRTLRYLDLSEVHITALGLKAVRQAILISTAPVEYLALRHNNIDDHGLRVLLIDEVNPKQLNFRARPQADLQCVLATLDLKANLVTDAGAAALADALGSDHTLVSLDLSDNRLTDAGQAALQAAADAVPRKLTVITYTTYRDRTCMRACTASSGCAVA